MAQRITDEYIGCELYLSKLSLLGLWARPLNLKLSAQWPLWIKVTTKWIKMQKDDGPSQDISNNSEGNVQLYIEHIVKYFL